MAAEHVPVPVHASDWASPPAPLAGNPLTTVALGPAAPPAAPERPRTPLDADLLEVASGMAPGKALDLGCGEGRHSIWLAQRGWVVTAVDPSPRAIAEAREQAAGAGVGGTIVFAVADLADWRPVSRYDLVFCAFAMPARGMGRSRMLEMAAAAVAGGGTILLSELDSSLRREGVPEKYLVTRDELERHLDGFRMERSAVRMTRRPHGFEERVFPVASVVATRRTDLRSL